MFKWRICRNQKNYQNGKMPLSKLCVGQKARVLYLENDNPALRRRLIDMGITEGVEVCIKKVAPLGDPVDIYLRGYELCLRKKDLEKITVEVIS